MSKALPKGLSIKMGFTIPVPSPSIYRLYQTDIFEYHHDTKRLILRTGGWNGPHTKKCINLALKGLGLNVRQIKGKWYVFDTTKAYSDDPRFMFQNDILEVTLD